jgi:hypothetical protein
VKVVDSHAAVDGDLGGNVRVVILAAAVVNVYHSDAAGSEDLE